MSRMVYTGWSRYSDTGAWHRNWKFEEDCPAVNAKKGDTMDDAGPETNARFKVRRWEDNEWTVVSKPDEDAVRKAFRGDGLPPWDPPETTDPNLLKVQRDTIRAFGLLADAVRLLIPKPEAPKPPKPEPKNQARGVYAETRKGRAVRFYAVNTEGKVVAERQVDPWHSTPAEEACLCSELWDLLGKVDPEPEPIPDSEAVAHLLANLEAPGPEEPDVWDLYDVRNPKPTDPRFHRVISGRDRVRKKYNRDLREQGKHCSDCGEHFKPRRIDQLRCPGCSAARKRGGTA